MPGVLHNAFIHQKRGDQGVESQLRETFIGDQLRVLRRLLPPRWRHPAEDRDDAESQPEVWHVQDSPTWVGGIDTGSTIEDIHFFLTIFSSGQGPPHHYWYLYLDKLMPGKSRSVVIKKILADQAVAAPFFAITFIYGAGLLEGNSLSMKTVL